MARQNGEDGRLDARTALGGWRQPIAETDGQQFGGFAHVKLSPFTFFTPSRLQIFHITGSSTG